MQCQTGCSDCCHVRLSVTGVEADAIRALAATMPAEVRAAFGTGPEDRCAALDGAGRCMIYDARPVICRSHGAPIRMRRDSLPVIAGGRTAEGRRGSIAGGRTAGSGAEGRGSIEACYRNFTHTEPAPDCVLDQTTLSALTLAVDRDAGYDGVRQDLAELLTMLRGA